MILRLGKLISPPQFTRHRLFGVGEEYYNHGSNMPNNSGTPAYHQTIWLRGIMVISIVTKRWVISTHNPFLRGLIDSTFSLVYLNIFILTLQNRPRSQPPIPRGGIVGSRPRSHYSRERVLDILTENVCMRAHHCFSEGAYSGEDVGRGGTSL